MSWPPDVEKIVPNAHDVFGVHEKLTSYSLNRDHRDGAEKAPVFRGVLGLTASDVDYLARALVDGLARTAVRRVRQNPPHGSCAMFGSLSGVSALAQIGRPLCAQRGRSGTRTMRRG